MGATAMLKLLLTHPTEFRTLTQFYLYYEGKRDIKAQQEHATSGWDRATMRRCWDFLDLTSRSFSAVIKELEGDLARAICIFYLVLRGLDTIEDDMTISPERKQSLLRSFTTFTVTPGWNFDGCGEKEKDRQLLVEYDVVVAELNLLSDGYKQVILDITSKMSTGMADYAHLTATSPTSTLSIATIEEYDLYCHYVAGLVGEGLSGIWSASGKEAPWLANELELSNSMGILLQKTNIIRDFREDCDDKRLFWPREIWGAAKYGSFQEMKDLHGSGEGVRERALWIQSAMVVDALRHATDALDYLRLLKNQSVFNFCAIPATMAMATLTLCFANGDMLDKNIKIRKAEAASLIMRSSNPREVSYIFREYARKIHAKANPADPNFLRISVACGKIEQWCEHAYPSFIILGNAQNPTPTHNPADARTRIVQATQKYEAGISKKARIEALRNGVAQVPGADTVPDANLSEVYMYMGAAFLIILGVTAVAAFGLIWATGNGIPGLS